MKDTSLRFRQNFATSASTSWCQPVSRPEAQARFTEAAGRQPLPELHLRADRSVAYHYIAETLADASKAGLSKIGFISARE